MDASIKIYVGCLGAAFLIVSAILILVLLHIKKIHRELTAFCGDTFPDDKNYIRTLNMKEKIEFLSAKIPKSIERKVAASVIEEQTRLKALQEQINPHFLYNTLDTIRGYAVMEEAPLTSDMIEVLSRLFRYTISQKNELITLQQELSIIYDYIKIQEYRINQHIVFLKKIDTDFQVMDYKIPRLIIQPFIENAIKHGFKGMTKDFTITLSVYRTQTRLVISIADNGGGMAPEELKALNLKLSQEGDVSVQKLNEAEKSSGTGIALANVSSRIKLIFGGAYGVVAYSALGRGSEFQISLPYPNDSKGRILS